MAATPEQLAELRRLTNEPDETVYSDVVLSSRLDAVGGDIHKLASTIWREKAARYAELIDVQEGSSVRKMSQLHSQAIKMADALDAGPDEPVGARRPARTRPIERQ